jgi:hypothetical protein
MKKTGKLEEKSPKVLLLLMRTNPILKTLKLA